MIGQFVPKSFRPFELALRMHGFMQWPAMTHKEMAVLKKVFLSLPKERPIKFFEYGAGFSTIYFARFLKEQGWAFHIDSVENNRSWLEKVSRMIRENGLEQEVTLHLKEFRPFWEKPGWDWSQSPAPGAFAPQSREEQEYIALPKALEQTFDLILVDGRFRRRCLELVLGCVARNGFVVLHDAQKIQYHDPLKDYPHGRFLDSGAYFPFEQRKYRIWLGSPASPEVERIAGQFI